MSLVICTPTEARGSILRDCNHLWRVGAPHRDTGRIKAPFAGTTCSTPSQVLSSSRGRERGPQPSAWKVNSTKFALAAFWDAPCERCAEATSLSILLCHRPDAQRRSHAANHIPRLSEIAARARLLPASYAHARWLAADHPGVGRDRRRAHIDQHHRGQSEGEERAPRSARGAQRGGPDERLAHSDGPRPGRGGYYRRCRRADRSAGQEVPQRGDLSVPSAGSGTHHHQDRAGEDQRDRARGVVLRPSLPLSLPSGPDAAVRTLALIHPSAWKGHSANFAFWAFSEVRLTLPLRA